MAITRKTSLWVAAESSYGADPSANGSGYKTVPVLGPCPRPTDGKATLATEYSTGRQWPTAPIAGPDGWTLDGVETPLIGLLTAAGDGVNASTKADDWLDVLLTHIFGTQYTTTGEGLAGGSSGSSLVCDTDAFTIQDLLPIWESALPSSGAARSQWELVTVDNGDGTYTVAPAFTADPTTAAVAYGAKIYRPSDAGGNSLALVVQDDDIYYTLLGARVTAFSIVGELGGIVRSRLSFAGDSKTEEAATKTALPARLAAPALTPVKTVLSPVWFNGTQYATRRFEIDFGLETAMVGSTAATHGRANWQNVSMRPRLTFEPLRTDALQNLRRNATAGRALVQLGSGAFASSILNSLAVAFSEGVATEVTDTDDQGVARKSVIVSMTDPVYFSGSTLSQVVQLARA